MSELAQDERIRPSPLRQALVRPELGSIAGTIVVFIFGFLATTAVCLVHEV